jgi:16S rRNA (cytosine967-C5)-methyltransferase
LSDAPRAGVRSWRRGARRARVLRDAVAEDLAQQARGGRDAPLLGALVSARCWYPRLEWQAQQLLSRPLKKGQLELAALLRIGLLQLQELRIPDHAAVSATVEAAAQLGARDARGLVNAVLRRFNASARRSTRGSRRCPRPISAIRPG